MFAAWGLSKYIRWFELKVDTGAENPKYCKYFRYSNIGAEVIKKLCNAFRENGIVEDGTEKWEALMVLADKHHQYDTLLRYFM